MCRAHVAHVSAQVQGHSKMSNIKQTNIRQYVMSAFQTLYQWKDFLGCAEPMFPMCQLKVKVTVKGQILNKQI